MLTYREINYQNDVPQIVTLLRTSLSHNQTEENFLWKHYDNPFGRSYGRVACDGEKIVGVRMFMFWEFKNYERKIKALRPVDTITHTDYRGKGLFKKLTLEGLNECSGKYDLIFNTPNKASYDGYIKMGWNNYLHDLHFKLTYIVPFFSKKDCCKAISLKEVNGNVMPEYSQYFQTFKSASYLQWRYKDSRYKVAKVTIDDFHVVIVYKIITIKGLKAILVEEILGDREYHSVAIKSLAGMIRINLIYYLKNMLTNFNFKLSANREKTAVVFRNDHKNLIQDIRFTTGDLEGRI